ncbi:MAG TPA: CDP-alcohol phosphatidyltransferase family protein [Pseudonocardia sp.]|uniref:phosphatidylinositol phosphate synthase n=1 Tax=Pseudonocardia sp. TaxID=60912 RepID=UPI002C7F1FD5|nr:CDP-alcohol phosphatidyltransferase family protein [Pseudonocardia sp.]HTF46003.1 CDP-alcohol phosphatidyltransferase family protein [Pseudonocardia sp.]
MLDNIVARASVGRVTDPVGRTLVRWGVPPDLVTVIGTVGSVAAALWFLPRGQLFLGVCVTTAFVLLDLVDGAMARALGSGTKFGAVLDSTCDRLADGALFAALAWWCLRLGDQPHTAVAAMISLVAGQVVSYLKARAEASGLSAQGGLVERAERLILALAGTALEGLGLVGALAVALWLLSVGSVITLGQRLLSVYRSARVQSAELDADREPDLVAELRPDREPEPDAGSATPDDGSVTR